MKTFRFFNIQQLFFLLLITVATPIKAQQPDSLSQKTGDRLSFNLSSMAFFRNTEYFNDFIDGYTLPGFRIEPRLQLLSGNTKISGGAYMLKFGGRDNGFHKVYPVFTIHQKDVFPGFSIVAGTIYGREQHQLPLPLYRYDNMYDGSPEYGVQLLFQYPHLKGDVWVNWEQFIMPGDTIQERFTQGMNWHISLLDNEKVHLEIPVVSLFTHRGGQVDKGNNSYIQTLWNVGTGLSAHFNTSNSLLNYYELSALILHYSDASPTPLEPYKAGTAFFPQATFGFANYWKLSAGWWLANRFITPRGDGLFSSLSTKNQGFMKPGRNIIFGTLNYERSLKNGLTTHLGAEAFYDYDSGKLDYTYTISLIFNRDFLISMLK